MADEILRRDGERVTVNLGERRRYSSPEKVRGGYWVGPGEVEVPVWKAEEWGLKVPDLEAFMPEPWDGYDAMNADDVIARAASLNADERAVVQRYEETHKNRVTVLAAL